MESTPGRRSTRWIAVEAVHCYRYSTSFCPAGPVLTTNCTTRGPRNGPSAHLVHSLNQSTDIAGTKGEGLLPARVLGVARHTDLVLLGNRDDALEEVGDAFLKPIRRHAARSRERRLGMGGHKIPRAVCGVAATRHAAGTKPAQHAH